MRGSQVIVMRPSETNYDTHGNEVVNYTQETVDDVLINTPSTEDVNNAQEQTNGVVVSFSLAFPNYYIKSLYGCKVVIPCINSEAEWDVIGDPQPVPHNMPHRLNRWNLKAYVTKSDGGAAEKSRR